MARRSVFVCTAVCSLLVFGAFAGERRKADLPLPSQFVMGRDTFFDFGPPFHYYDVIVVEPIVNGTRISRILLTPAREICSKPGKVELQSVVISQSVNELLDGANPCTIPDKELRREQKRCRHCMVFSGANVMMGAQCGAEQRRIRMDILDRDIYDPGRAQTPERTSWTVRLLSRLDGALGPGPMEKPAFSNAPTPPATPLPQSEMLNGLAAGRFDSLFNTPACKLSQMYPQ